MKRVFAAAISVWMLAPLPSLAVVGMAQAGEASVSQSGAARVDITLVTAQGRRAFSVELARSENERSKGLMFRRSLAPNGGMLFIFDNEDRVAMWMKNTFIPLDMLFIDARGRVVNIARNTKPQSLDVIPAAAPVLAVLEVAGGTADRLGIAPGDRVLSEFFSNK